MRTLEKLKTMAPKIEWSVDPITGAIAAVIDDMEITDPFRSECGRFPATPDYYGIPTPVALEMMAHNLLCKD